MNPEGTKLPSPADPSKSDPKELLEQIRNLNQQLTRVRQESTRQISESQAKCKAEMDKLRQTTHQHGQDLQNQNSALLQSLGRMKAENDDLTRQLIVLQARAGNGEVARGSASPADSASTVAVLPQAPALGGESIPMPPR